MFHPPQPPARPSAESPFATLRVAVVDDEGAARTQILRFLRSEPARVVGTAASGAQAVELLNRSLPDLVFLDIDMPDCTGFDVMARIGAHARPTVVFVTASEAHAARAFEVRALDYLVKPFGRDRFHAAFSRAAEILARQRGDAHEGPAGEGRGAAGRWLEWIFVGARDRGSVLNVSEIERFQAEDNYVRVYSSGREYLIRETMNTLEARLDPRLFARIHRSSIVRLSFVRELRNWFDGSYLVVLKDGAELKMSRVYRVRLMQDLIGQYF